MKWPEKPTCHKNEQHMPGMPADHWYAEGRADRPFRSCSYCGSIHPEDLVRFLTNGATLESADWKYGWPHKFYVHGVPNPQAGQIVEIGSDHKGGVTTPIMGPAPATTFVKWYSQHLSDDGFDNEAQVALQEALRVSGIDFCVSATGAVGYRRMSAEEMSNNDKPKSE